MTAFRQAAEERIRELERRDKERQIAAEARAAEQRATQAQERERRQRAQQEAAEQQATEHRARLARRFGIAATRVVLAAEYRLFVIEHRDLAIAYRHQPPRHHPGGHAPRTDTPVGASSWDQQARLQRVLNVGVDGPLLVRGDQILDHTNAVDRLVVDATVDELTNLAGGSR